MLRGARDKIVFMSDLAGDEDAARTRGHRAIGVVYDPEWEPAGNYVPARLTDR